MRVLQVECRPTAEEQLVSFSLENGHLPGAETLGIGAQANKKKQNGTHNSDGIAEESAPLLERMDVDQKQLQPKTLLELKLGQTAFAPNPSTVSCLPLEENAHTSHQSGIPRGLLVIV